MRVDNYCEKRLQGRKGFFIPNFPNFAKYYAKHNTVHNSKNDAMAADVSALHDVFPRSDPKEKRMVLSYQRGLGHSIRYAGI